MISFKSSLPTIPLYVLGAYIVIGKMIRQATLSLNQATGDKKGAIDSVIDPYLPFMQEVISVLQNRRMSLGKPIGKGLRTNTKTPYNPTVKDAK